MAIPDAGDVPTSPPQSSPLPPSLSLSTNPQRSSAAGGDVAAVAGAGGGGGVLAVAGAVAVWWLVRHRRKRRKQQMDEQAKISDRLGEAATLQGMKVLMDSAEDYKEAESEKKKAKREEVKTVVHADTNAEMIVHEVELDSHPVAMVDPRGGVEEEDAQWRDARLKLDGAHQLEWSELELTKAVGACLWGRRAQVHAFHTSNILQFTQNIRAVGAADTGRGSFGQVFLGRWRASEVAIKVMHMNANALEVQTAAFVREVCGTLACRLP